jgi:hypothetical protein
MLGPDLSHNYTFIGGGGGGESSNVTQLEGVKQTSEKVKGN